MNIEINRLQTFNEWPSDAEVNPQRIAKAGFFATKQGLEVECFACHVKISQWNYGDQVMARHAALSPTCPFVTNPITSGNIPVLSTFSVPTSSSDPYRESVETRLATFENWPSSNVVSPESLANAGFYYLGDGDNTKCAFCKGVVREWEQGDNPDYEHRRHFPNCPYVTSVINKRCGPVAPYKKPLTNAQLVQNDQNLDELGIQTHKGPKRSDFSTVESRLRSFVGWSSDLIQTPELLAQAGFYYEGTRDQVRCFHCDGGLKHWDPHDDPWTEHARWFPTCAFVKLVKGQDYVTACARNIASHSIQKIQSTRRKYPVTEQEVQAQLSTPQAMAALNIGLTLETVKRAIREKLEQTGIGYSQGDALVEAALNIQHEHVAEHDQDTLESLPHVDCALREAIASVKSPECQDIPVDIANEVTEQFVEEPVRSNAPVKKTLTLEEENRLLKEARLCKICMDAEVGIVFLPCGHLVTCVRCAPNLEDCPVCRSAIKASVRTFLA
ncbi:unnamed protein product [Callosobruchus maculatus]|uniref:RING-type domain-containing protein n=1 Tax=Callosobruchus maculatus TaxID=64391 RepID=A0A653DSU4_CALMS|nr:unnamed protein product [Callosobruchus maculatus]